MSFRNFSALKFNLAALPVLIRRKELGESYLWQRLTLVCLDVYGYLFASISVNARRHIVGQSEHKVQILTVCKYVAPLLNEIASCGGVGSELSVDYVGHQRSVQHGKRALDISVQIAFIHWVSGKLLLKRKNGLFVVELGQKFCLHVVGEHSLDSVYNLLLGAEENEFARAGVLRSAGIYFGVFKLKILGGKGLVKRVCDYVIFGLGNARRKLFILLAVPGGKEGSPQGKALLPLVVAARGKQNSVYGHGLVELYRNLVFKVGGVDGIGLPEGIEVAVESLTRQVVAVVASVYRIV